MIIMNTPNDQKGFSLIELMIVVAIISILAAIAIPGYLGMQNKANKGVIKRTASTAESDILGWLQSARKSGSTLREIDTNGNGIAGDAADLSNYDLNTDLATPNQLCQRYINARSSTNTEYSPWDGLVSLWTTGAVTNGRISCNHPVGASMITLEGWDKLGTTLIYSKEISID